MDPFQEFETILTIIKWLFFIALFIGAFFIVLRIKRAFNQERIIERWSALIEGANGSGDKVITGVIQKISKVESPNIHMTKKMVNPGKGFIQESREFLVAEHKLFDTYDMYIGARDYGKQLFVSWYLVAEPISFLRSFKRYPIETLIKMPFLIFASVFSKSKGGSGEIFSLMNLFDNEELSAYTATVHHALLDSVKELMEDRNLDFTKIDQKSRGFLNIS